MLSPLLETRIERHHRIAKSTQSPVGDRSPSLIPAPKSKGPTFHVLNEKRRLNPGWATTTSDHWAGVIGFPFGRVPAANHPATASSRVKMNVQWVHAIWTLPNVSYIWGNGPSVNSFIAILDGSHPDTSFGIRAGFASTSLGPSPYVAVGRTQLVLGRETFRSPLAPPNTVRIGEPGSTMAVDIGLGPGGSSATVFFADVTLGTSVPPLTVRIAPSLVGTAAAWGVGTAITGGSLAPFGQVVFDQAAYGTSTVSGKTDRSESWGWAGRGAGGTVVSMSHGRITTTLPFAPIVQNPNTTQVQAGFYPGFDGQPYPYWYPTWVVSCEQL
jgi:hypothetical protein